MNTRIGIVILLSIVIVAVSPAATVSTSMLGKHVRSFSLKNVDGQMLNLDAQSTARGAMVVFSCNHCPFARLYTARLNELSDRYAAKGVPLYVINPMDTAVYAEEGFANMQLFAREHDFHFPYLIDPSQSVAREFQARHTPQAYLLWKENGEWTIRYNGAIDDNGEHPEEATPYLANAVDQMLSGQAVVTGETHSLGCRINYRK